MPPILASGSFNGGGKGRGGARKRAWVSAFYHFPFSTLSTGYQGAYSTFVNRTPGQYASEIVERDKSDE